MRYDLQLRPGMAALAAAIALSATPVFAQDASQSAVQPPVAEAPPAPDAPAEPAAAPVEISPVLSQADAASAAMQAAPAPAPVPTMEPIVHQPSAADLRATRTAERAPVAPRPTPTNAQRSVAPETRAPITATATAAPATAAPKVVAAPDQPAAPAAAATRTSTTTTVDADVVPYIGVGAAALLLVGGAAALSRRRRRDEEATDDRYENEHVLDLGPATQVSAPPLAAPVVARAAPAPAAPASLPNGFDLSRFGRHTQAAYRGPTPENPSLMLRKRLKRASFFDGRERIAAETGTTPVGIPVAAAARATQANAASEGQIVIRPRPAKTGSFFRPSFAGSIAR